VQHAIWELRHQQVLAQTLMELERRGVRPVLIKGTSLAYSLYPDPALRTRADTDLIIPLDARKEVHQTLIALGFEEPCGVSGELIAYQGNYTLALPGASTHVLDLHWKINNSELLSRLFVYEELLARAQPLPTLCPIALGASHLDALLLACMHRATHRQNPYYVNGQAHNGADRLVWLWDIHLLARQLTPTDWDEFMRQATSKGLRAVCLEGILHARARFSTACPSHVLAALAQAGAELPATYLEGGKLRQQWMDFLALRAPAKQIAFVGELFFPSPAYMYAKYPQPRPRWLPWLYLRRATAGILKTLGAKRSTP